MNTDRLFIPKNLPEPKIYVDFDSFKDCTIIGEPCYTESFDGSLALHIENRFGKTAKNYIEFKNCPLDDSFSISLWYQATACGGCGFYPPKIKDEFYGMDHHPVCAGGTLFANTSVAEELSTGFSAMNLSFDINTKFSICDGEIAFRSVKSYPLTVIQDMRWHNIVFSFNRDSKSADVYIDSVLTCTIDFSNAKPFTNNSTLVFGADSLGQYGLESGNFDYIAVYDYPLPESAIAEVYERQHLLQEIRFAEKQIKSAEAGERFSEEHIKALESALEAAIKNKDSDEPASVCCALRKAINNFLMGNRPEHTVILCSDSHLVSANENEPPCKNLINLFKANKELNINSETLINAGDHCNTRDPENHDHYFDIVDKYFRTDGQIEATCIGNHQYTHYALPGVDIHTPIDTSRFRERISQRIDLTLPPNKKLLNNDGILSKEYYYTTDGFIHCITLNPWEDCGWKLMAKITEEQCDWLEETLSYCDDGKPVFIVCHYPVDELSTLNNKKSGYNSRTRINHLLKKYNKVFFVRGHSHNGLGKSGIKHRESYIEIDCPTTLGGRGRDGHYDSAAYFMFMYKDSLVLRAFNCRTMKWMPEYDQTTSYTREIPENTEKITVKETVAPTTVTEGFNKAEMTYFAFSAKGTNTGITGEIYDDIIKSYRSLSGSFKDAAVAYMMQNDYAFDLYDSLSYIEIPPTRNKLVHGGIPFISNVKSEPYGYIGTGYQGNSSISSAIEAGKALKGNENYPICALKVNLEKQESIKGFLIANGKCEKYWNARGYSLYISDSEKDLFEDYNKVITFKSEDGILNDTSAYPPYYYKETPYGHILTTEKQEDEPVTFSNVQHFTFTENLPRGKYVGLLVFDGGNEEYPRADIIQFRILG